MTEDIYIHIYAVMHQREREEEIVVSLLFLRSLFFFKPSIFTHCPLHYPAVLGFDAFLVSCNMHLVSRDQLHLAQKWSRHFSFRINKISASFV